MMTPIQFTRVWFCVRDGHARDGHASGDHATHGALLRRHDCTQEKESKPRGTRTEIFGYGLMTGNTPRYEVEEVEEVGELKERPTSRLALRASARG